MSSYTPVDDPYIPDSVAESPTAEAQVKNAMRDKPENPGGHVIFKEYDATYVEAIGPDNMFEGHARQVATNTEHDDEPDRVVCSCGRTFDDTSDAHIHLRHQQGEVTHGSDDK